MTQIRVAVDRDVHLVARRGRFDVDRDRAKSVRGLAEEMGAMCRRMVADMAKRGFEHLEAYGWDLEGPFPHLVFDDDTSADPGTRAQLDPRDLDALAAWDAEQARRRAKKSAAEQDKVDYLVIGVFRTKTPAYQRVVGGSDVWTPS